MKSKRKALTMLMGVVLLAVLIPAIGYAAVPLQITYQGQLTDTEGNPVPDGDYEMSFALYDAPAGGTALWSEAQAVTVTNGIYNVILGQPENELDPTGFDEVLYLGVTVGTDSEMTPRQPLTSVGYALRAEIADTVKEGAITTVMIQDGAVDTTKLADNAITEEKLGDGTVTTDKIQDGAALAEISDNDGEGSGLDADLLDGLDSTDFMLVDTDNWVDEAGDTMTGTLNLAVDGLVAGTDQLVISGGNVGIGTSSPGERLDVDGDINTSGTYKIAGNTALSVEGFNTFLGYYAGYSNTTGGSNTFGGYDAGRLNTTGQYNTFLGRDAGFTNTEGGDNTFLGYYAGRSNTKASYNTFVGRSAGYKNTKGEYNTFVGYNAGLQNTEGANNTFLGDYAGQANTTGNQNLFVGAYAGMQNTGGIHNTFLGLNAGRNNATGNGNVFLGYRSGYNEAGSNKLYIANSDTSTPLMYGEFDKGVLAINGTAQITGDLTVTGTVAGSGINADTLDGLDATDFMLAGVDNWINEAGDTMTGQLQIQVASGDGLSSTTASSVANTQAIYGHASASSGATYGVYGQSDSTDGRGIYGYATATSGNTYGVYGASYSTSGRGVYGTAPLYGVSGYASATSGTNYGVYGQSDSTSGRGVYGYAPATTGTTFGVWGRSYSTDGRGVYGEATAGSGTTFGLYGQSDSTSGRGVLGYAPATTGTTCGVLGHSDSTSGYGVYGRAPSYGVYGFASADSGTTYGVYGVTSSTDGYGGYFSAAGTNGIGIFAYGGYAGYAADFQGNVRIRDRSSGNTVMELGAGLDYAEGFDVSNKKQITPGSVLIIDPDNPGELTMGGKPYDTKVAGIVAGAKGTGSGVRLGAGQYDYDVALAGRVYCNVDATESDVEPGDLLTTSGTPGYAMKATDYARAQGAILGKAMQGLEKGERGQILVLVTLQ